MSKQEIYNILYQFNGRESVLDVGCGSTGHPKGVHWTGIDLEIGGLDWYDFNPDRYDVIIANDIFPNVDQRLELFLEMYLPRCVEMRLSLTYFDFPKWYRVKRVDGDEILTMLQWSKKQVLDALNGYTALSIVEYEGEFENRRSVLLVSLKGGLK